MGVVKIIKVPDEHQVGDLLDNIERVGESPGPEYASQRIDLAFEFPDNHSYSTESIWREDYKTTIP